MTVSMDGLRWQLLSSYNRLTQKLNRETKDGEVRIDANDIQNEMDNIRSCIVALAYMYDESEDGFDILENPTFEHFGEEQ
jgi:ABC-type phosphate transport system ATPase subunit